MASERRIAKLQSLMLREVSDIIQNRLKDPRMGFVSVTKVELTQDVLFAKVSVSVLGGQTEKTNTMQALGHARGFIQREVGQAMRIHSMPRISFQLDESIEKAIEICKIIDRAVERDREAHGKPKEEGGEKDEEQAFPEK
jgi:ribosome-binding factor A